MSNKLLMELLLFNSHGSWALDKLCISRGNINVSKREYHSNYRIISPCIFLRIRITLYEILLAYGVYDINFSTKTILTYQIRLLIPTLTQL